jgi:hypothetical protein
MNRKAPIGIFVGLIILAGGFLVWKSNSYPKVSTSSVPDISIDTQGALAQLDAAKKASTPAEWKEYQMQTPYLHFSLKHPADVVFKKFDATGDSGGSLAIFTDTPMTRAYVAGTYQGEGPLGMSISVSNTFKTPEAYIKQTEQNVTLQSYATTTLFGQTAYVVSGQGADRYDIILFSHNNKLYQVMIAYGMPNDEMRPVFYKILTSLKFKN